MQKGFGIEALQPSDFLRKGEMARAEGFSSGRANPTFKASHQGGSEKGREEREASFELRSSEMPRGRRIARGGEKERKDLWRAGRAGKLISGRGGRTPKE